MADTSDDAERYVRLPRLNSTDSRTPPNVPSIDKSTRSKDLSLPPNKLSFETNTIERGNDDKKSILPMDNITSHGLNNSRSSTKSYDDSLHNDVPILSENLQDCTTSTEKGGLINTNLQVSYSKPTSEDDKSLKDKVLNIPGGQSKCRTSPYNDGIDVSKHGNNSIRYTSKPDLDSKPMSPNQNDLICYEDIDGDKNHADSERYCQDRKPGESPDDFGPCKQRGNEDPQGAPASPDPNTLPPDGGWGWVVCFTCLWVNGTVMGTVNTFGILYNHMREIYAQGDEEVSLKTSFVGSCMNGVMFLMSCVSGILCDVIGLRHTAFIGGVLCVIGFLSSAFVSQLELLYLTYGVILGTGFGLVFSPMVAISGHYFKKHIGLVNGIVTFGASAFTVAMSFALPLLLKKFGLQETLLSFAGLGVILTLCTLTWKPLVSREHGNVNTDETGSACKHCLSFVSRKVLNGRVWRNRRFLCWSLAMSVSRFGYLEPYFHMVNHVSHILPGSNSSILITIMAAVSGVSKLGVGLLSDQMKKYRIYFQQVALLVYGVIVLCIPFSGTFTGFVLIAVFLGVADAVIMALFGPNAIQLVGPGNASQAVGFASLIAIPTFLSAPAITGTMHDHLDSYDVGFHVTGAITLLSSFLMCLVGNPFEKHSDASKSSPKLSRNHGSSQRRSSHAYVNSAFKGKETNSACSESHFTGTQRYDNQLYDTSDVRGFESSAVGEEGLITNHSVSDISAVGERARTTNHNASDSYDVGHVGHVTDCFYGNVADIQNDRVHTKKNGDQGKPESTDNNDVRL